LLIFLQKKKISFLRRSCPPRDRDLKKQPGSAWVDPSAWQLPCIRQQLSRGREQMSKSLAYLAAAAAALVGTAAFAADQTPQTTAAQQAAEKDFGRVSTDGFNAMHDVSLARWAIFNGDTNDAKQDIVNASNALNRAQSDDSVFLKAEADLKPPPGVTQPNPQNQQPGTRAIKWLPVDGAVALGEDYVASPAKSAGVAKANAQLKQGDHAGAMHSLRLAGVTMSFDEEVAPLAKTIAGVSKAEQLLDSGQFYEANQELKGVQDGVRFDVVDMSGTPKAQANGASAGTHVASAENGGTGQK
jgi:hypothetical protein